MDKGRGEVIAIRTMEWLASEEDELSRFLASTGMTLEAARAELGNQEFLASVLDYILSSEPLLLKFCETTQISSETPRAARQFLPGGDVPHWT